MKYFKQKWNWNVLSSRHWKLTVESFSNPKKSVFNPPRFGSKKMDKIPPMLAKCGRTLTTYTSVRSHMKRTIQSVARCQEWKCGSDVLQVRVHFGLCGCISLDFFTVSSASGVDVHLAHWKCVRILECGLHSLADCFVHSSILWSKSLFIIKSLECLQVWTKVPTCQTPKLNYCLSSSKHRHSYHCKGLTRSWTIKRLHRLKQMHLIQLVSTTA